MVPGWGREQRHSVVPTQMLVIRTVQDFLTDSFPVQDIPDCVGSLERIKGLENTVITISTNPVYEVASNV